MIRSTKATLNFVNKSKLDSVHQFIDEYKKVMCDIVDNLWELEKVPRLVPNDITSKINTWLSSRAVQCAAKQASGIVRGTQTKQKRRLFVINQLKEAKKFKKAKKLQQIYNNIKQSKPNLQHIECELDSRFVKIDLNNKTSFDGWITLTCLGNKMKLILPFKQHKHFNKMLKNGTIKGGVRLSSKNVTFMFDNYRIIDRLKWWNYGTFAKDKREKLQRLIIPKDFGSIKKIIFSISLPYEVTLREHNGQPFPQTMIDQEIPL